MGSETSTALGSNSAFTGPPSGYSLGLSKNPGAWKWVPRLVRLLRGMRKGMQVNHSNYHQKRELAVWALYYLSLLNVVSTKLTNCGMTALCFNVYKMGCQPPGPGCRQITKMMCTLHADFWGQSPSLPQLLSNYGNHVTLSLPLWEGQDSCNAQAKF